ncbi:hypothetical protein SLS56_012246 [Neofusicoccum ribis]|uniref:Protein kinase domain-containing protein n=1 Tax=Neofusicoccum ribis TaxID=45134 RepID=A0ABR3S9C9_9PEZI
MTRNPRSVSKKADHDAVASSSKNSSESLDSTIGTGYQKKAALRLQQKLQSSHIEQPSRSLNFYIPEDRKRAIITFEVILEQIRFVQPGKASELSNTAYGRAKNLFTILAYMGRAYEICEFLSEKVSDDDLPFDRDVTNNLIRRNGQKIECASHWQLNKTLDFARKQWSVLVPVFSTSEHYEFHKNTILPFNHDEEVSEFEKEQTILKELGRKEHGHLVKLLVSYKYWGNYHLVFLLATGNLRDFWRKHPDPKFTKEAVLWSLKQMKGISHAIYTIHNFRITRPHVVEGGIKTSRGSTKFSFSLGEEQYGRHGDLKPENILWFSQTLQDQDSYGTFQIADLGLARFHGQDTRTKQAPYTIFSSPTYEPPECHTFLPVSRAYDFWSLGCLFLEWISWLLEGWSAIEKFSETRLEKSFILHDKGEIADDYFWSLMHEENPRRATIRAGVLNWVRGLRESHNCSELMHELLSLVMTGLLCIKPNERIDAADLHQRLDSMLKRAEKESEYGFTPKPLEKKEPNEATETKSATRMNFADDLIEGIPVTEPSLHSSKQPTWPSETAIADIKKGAGRSTESTALFPSFTNIEDTMKYTGVNTEISKADEFIGQSLSNPGLGRPAATASVEMNTVDGTKSGDLSSSRFDLAEKMANDGDSIYSLEPDDTADPSYIKAVAHILFEQLGARHMEKSSFQAVLHIMEQTLKAFASKLGYEVVSKEAQEARVFIQKHRKDIKKSLEEIWNRNLQDAPQETTPAYKSDEVQKPDTLNTKNRKRHKNGT